MSRIFIPLCLAILLAPYGLVSPAQAASSKLFCGEDINQSMTLHHNLVCSGDGLVITKNGITFDCNGYTITGLIPGIAEYGIVLAANGTTVKNCTVSHFDFDFIIFPLNLPGPYTGGVTNTLSHNVANGANRVGFDDGSSGTGTLGTANTYVGNTCTGTGYNSSTPLGLCTVI